MLCTRSSCRRNGYDRHHEIRQPTIFLDLSPAEGTHEIPDDTARRKETRLKNTLIQKALNPLLMKCACNGKGNRNYFRHMEISLNELINRQNLRMAELLEAQQNGDTSQPLRPT